MDCSNKIDLQAQYLVVGIGWASAAGREKETISKPRISKMGCKKDSGNVQNFFLEVHIMIKTSSIMFLGKDDSFVFQLKH